MEQLLNENFEDTGARRSEVIIDGVRKFAWEDDYKKSWRVTGSGDESLRAAQLRMEFEQKLQKRADLQVFFVFFFVFFVFFSVVLFVLFLCEKEVKLLVRKFAWEDGFKKS